MKNSNYAEHNYQDRKFRNQVSHLSGFIGMPIWYGRNPTLSEIREYDRRVLEKQALGFELKRKKLLKRLFAVLRLKTFNIFLQTSDASQKKNKIKGKAINPIETGSECCG